jgi:hypothetical protein
MRFKTFLAEDNHFSLDEVVALISRHCGSFLKSSGGVPVFRGMKASYGNDVAIKFDHPSNRSPKDSSKEFNVMFNAAIEHVHGVQEIRAKSLFASGKPSQAAAYGPLHFLFPIGGFEFMWSPEIIDAWGDDKIFYGKIMSTIVHDLNISRMEYNHVLSLKQVISDLIDVGHIRTGHQFLTGITNTLAQKTFATRFNTGRRYEYDDREPSIKIPDNMFDVLKEGLTEVGSMYRHTGSLVTAIKSKCEIMFYFTEGYFMVPVELLQQKQDEPFAFIYTRLLKMIDEA